MKKSILLLTIFLVTNLFAQPVIKNGTFYTQTGLRAINLAPLVTGGTPPYRFHYLIPQQQFNPPFSNVEGTMNFRPLNKHGMVEIGLVPASNSATLKFKVRDNNEQDSQLTEIKIIRGTPKA